MVPLRPRAATSGISALLLLAAFTANATSIEIRPLGNSKVPLRLEVTLINEGGGVTLNPKAGAPLVFELPPPAEGAWEDVLSVTADSDAATVPLRVTRYHRQFNLLRVPLYLDPNPAGEINNPEAQEIEPSQEGQENADENMIKYFKAARGLQDQVGGWSVPGPGRTCVFRSSPESHRKLWFHTGGREGRRCGSVFCKEIGRHPRENATGGGVQYRKHRPKA